MFDKTIRITYLDLFLMLTLLLLMTLSVVFNISVFISKVIAIFVVLLSLYNIFLVRKNWSMFIALAFVAYSNYSICVADYLFPIKNTIFTSFRNDVSAIIGINILLIFTTSLTILLKCVDLNNYENNLQPFFENSPSNSIITFVSIVALIVVLIFGFGRPDVDGQRGNPSAYFEYALIIFLLAYYYSKFTFERIVLSILLLLYVLTNLIYGGRVTALQMIIMFFMIFFSHKYSISKSLPYIFVAFVTFYAIGILRTKFTFSADTLILTLNKLLENKFASDTAYSSYYTSQTFVKVTDFLSLDERITLSFKNILLNIFGGIMVKDGNIAAFTHNFFAHYYGGVYPFFGWFYLGYFGVIVFAIYLFLLFKSTLQKKDEHNGLKKCLSVYIAATVPRWYLYSPSQLLRGVLLLTCLYLICAIFNNIGRNANSAA